MQMPAFCFISMAFCVFKVFNFLIRGSSSNLEYKTEIYFYKDCESSTICTVSIFYKIIVSLNQQPLSQLHRWLFFGKFTCEVIAQELEAIKLKAIDARYYYTKHDYSNPTPFLSTLYSTFVVFLV